MANIINYNKELEEVQNQGLNRRFSMGTFFKRDYELNATGTTRAAIQSEKNLQMRIRNTIPQIARLQIEEPNEPFVSRTGTRPKRSNPRLPSDATPALTRLRSTDRPTEDEQIRGTQEKAPPAETVEDDKQLSNFNIITDEEVKNYYTN